MRNRSKKVAAVTGAAGGIGQSIALCLLNENYHVILLDKDETALAASAESLTDPTHSISTYALDVTNEEQVTDSFRNIVENFGRFDVLINNAGVLRDGLLVKTKEGSITKKLSLDEWQIIINTNLSGVFLCGREAAVQMIQCGQGGTIINMTSLARQGNFGQSSYSAAKAGVEALTVTWAQELSRHKIRAAGIAPGVVETPMTAGMKPSALDALCQQIPSGRIGKPEEIASTVKFILNNPYVNGRIIEVDGGLRF